VRLTEIFRQAAESLIVVNAHRIHDGEEPELRAPTSGTGEDKRDFFFLEESDPAKEQGEVDQQHEPPAERRTIFFPIVSGSWNDVRHMVCDI